MIKQFELDCLLGVLQLNIPRQTVDHIEGFSTFYFSGLNPEPMVEIDFWESRARNLECIFDQLRSPKVRKMAEILERTESSYFNAFKILFQDVVNGENI